MTKEELLQLIEQFWTTNGQGDITGSVGKSVLEDIVNTIYEAIQNNQQSLVQSLENEVNKLVSKSGNQTISDVKTFSNSPVIPSATNNTEAQNKAGVETQITARQETVRSQSDTKSPTSKLMDNELSKKITKKLGANLFNPSEFKSGYYLNTSGVETVNSSWGVTGFIPFTESDVNVISNFYAPIASGGKNILYDSNKNFIASFQGNTATWQSNVAYVRFSGTPIVATNTIMVNVGTILQTLVPYTETFGLVSTESLVDGAITTPKVKDGTITGAKLETDYKNLLVQKFVKQSDTTTKYLNRPSSGVIQYPDSQGYAWAMTIVPTVQMVVNGAIMKPTKTMAGVLLCVLQLPDDISVLTGTITTLQEIDITKKWNENIGVETEFYFDTATFLVGKNYAIGYRDANLSTHIGFYHSSFITGMSQVRPRILSGTVWAFATNSTSVPFVVPGLFDVVKVKTALNADKSIEGREIADGTILGSKVKDGAITEGKVADNTVSTTKVKDGAITPVKANFFQASKNLFNPNDSGIALGYYVVNTNGNLSVNTLYNATGFIPVIGSQSYTMSYKHNIAWYDANKVYISGSSSIDTNPTQQAPANAAFCRCTVITTSWGSFQFELGTQQTSYEAYGFKIKQEYIPESDSYFPNIAMTRKLHILANNENSMYHKSLIERWNPYRYLIQSTGTNWGYYERYSRVNAASAGNITYKIYDGVTLSLKQTKTATVVVGNPATNNGAKIVQVIGDSFSYNGYWFDKTNQLCPALSFVGMRKSYNTLLKAEGRGGWTLALYMTSKHATNDSFSPFLHPADPYKYYGNTAFWIAVKAGSGDYGIAGFTDIANTIGFNATTGLKAVPAANDVMYNDANARYEVYNGSAWVEISETTLAFTFNYAKYLTTWGITMPDILGIMLGCNDFRTTVLNDAAFATWKTNMDTLLTSVRSAATALGKTVKIAICLPVTETASANNSAFINPAFQRANMFDARRRIIEAFDNSTYSDNNIDIVDTGTAVDGDFGFAMSELKPFSDYAETQREMYSGNVPHPSNGGYAQIGVRFAAYIQSVR